MKRALLAAAAGAALASSLARAVDSPPRVKMPIVERRRETPRPKAAPKDEKGDGSCPADMAPFPGYCVDRHEAFLQVRDGDGWARWSPHHNPGTKEVRAANGASQQPQAYINGDQAAAACERAGKRLCSQEEWRQACRGSGGGDYPYGSEREDGHCKDYRRVHPVVQYYNAHPDKKRALGKEGIWGKGMRDPGINQQEDTVARSGAYPKCTNGKGTFDMVGNLHEWVADPDGTFLGGFYVEAAVNGKGCQYRTTRHTSPYWDYSTGFRCCKGR